MKKRSYIIYVILFVVICIFPLCSMSFYSNNESIEKRELHKKPLIKQYGKWNKNYFSQYTDYFNDNFGFRQDMAGLNACILRNVFFTSSEKNVVVGSNGWLYYSDTIDDYCGLNRMNKRQLHNCSRVLYLIQQYVQSKGAKFVFTIAPNKNTLYNENMPYYYRKGEEESDYDVLCKYLSDDNVNNVNLKYVFNNDDRVLYHKMDTHWNNQGAALAHKAILKSFGLEGIDFDKVHYYGIKNFTGDLYQMLYPNGNARDVNIMYDYYFHYNYKGKKVTTDMMKFDSWNENAKGSLLMFRDSFGNALTPFMSEEFAHCSFTKAVPYNLSVMETQPYDYVVIELAERHLKQLQESIPIVPAQETDYLPEYTMDSADNVKLNVDEKNNLGLVELYGYTDSDFTSESSNIYIQIVSEGKIYTFEAFPALNDVRENTQKRDYGYGIYIPQSIYKKGETKAIVITEKDGKMYAVEKRI